MNTGSCHTSGMENATTQNHDPLVAVMVDENLAAGYRLVAWRILHACTRPQIAATLGLKKETVAKIEAGRVSPGLQTAAVIQKLAGIPITHWCADVGEPDKETASRVLALMSDGRYPAPLRFQARRALWRKSLRAAGKDLEIGASTLGGYETGRHAPPLRTAALLERAIGIPAAHWHPVAP
jgi:DNA-binding XRE family transcriptional regulator